MIRHREIAKADAHFVVVPYVERVDAGEDAAVPAPNVLI